MLTQDTKQTRPVVVPSSEAVSTAPETKTLRQLAQAFCEDAQKDNIRYLIRSNTSHDGE